MNTDTIASEKYNDTTNTYLDPRVCLNELAKLIIEFYNLYTKAKESSRAKKQKYVFVEDYDFDIYIETGYDANQLIATSKNIVELLYNPTYEDFKSIVNTHFSDSTDAITYKLFMGITILEGYCFKQ